MKSDSDDKSNIFCSHFKNRHALQKLHLFSATKKNGCRKFFAACLFKSLTCLKIALYRFKWLVDSRKQHSLVIAKCSVHGAHNHYCNLVMRKFIIKLRHVTFHKHRNCSTIYKWRYSLLQIYLSLWLKQTKVAVQLKQSHLLRGLPRLDAGCSFGEVVLTLFQYTSFHILYICNQAIFRSQLELSRKRRLILNSGNGFRHRYLLRFYILRWRANMAFSRRCRIFLQVMTSFLLPFSLAFCNLIFLTVYS